MTWKDLNKKKAYENKRYHTRKDLVKKAKDKPCMDCGNKYPYFVMDFDHRDPSLKKFNISQSLNRSNKDVFEEIAKCDVVCANCHRLRTHAPLV